jgi:hypothetical protein
VATTVIDSAWNADESEAIDHLDWMLRTEAHVALTAAIRLYAGDFTHPPTTSCTAARWAFLCSIVGYGFRRSRGRFVLGLSAILTLHRRDRGLLRSSSGEHARCV